MPFEIIRNDITCMRCDAIVNTANPAPIIGGSSDARIHGAAGPGPLEARKKIGPIAVGEAAITPAFRLQAKYVIHTVGPIWRGGQNGERELLISAYRNSMTLAVQYKCETVAFPLISAGVYGYPKAQAIQVAMDTVSAFLLEHDLDMTVYIVVFNKESFQLSTKLFSGVRQYIDDHYVEIREEPCRERMRRMQVMDSMPCMESKAAMSLEDALGQLDESFSQMVLRKIQEKGMKNADCYKKANIDRKLFSKIRSDVHYKPSKPTALAFAISLELSLAETEDMLRKAGFALSHSNKFDIIIEYFISKGNYNIFEINEALFAFDQSLLGA